MVDVIKKNDACPCGSGEEFSACCDLYLSGKQKPKTAEATMRSRYAAFVTGNVDYIMNSHHPETVKQIDRAGIEDWSKNAVWQSLDVISVENDGEDSDEAVVEFLAKYVQEGKNYQHHEVALFKKNEADWFFYDVKKNRPIKIENKIGRNDPCHCGSGKKFKKCHGKSVAA